MASTIVFTGAVMLSRERMDRQAWALVAVLILASTAIELLVSSLRLSLVLLAVIIAFGFGWRLLQRSREVGERPSAL